jgi:hypothetical protein
MQLRPEPAFRATAAWTMGDTGDTRFLPVLARMIGDPEPAVKSSAVRAFQELHRKENAEKELPEIFQVEILGRPEVEASTLRFTLFVRRGWLPCRELPPVSIRVLVDGENAYDYLVVAQENKVPSAVVMLVPVAEDLNPAGEPELRKSLEECFSSRPPGEPWLIGRFSRRQVDAPGRPVLRPVRTRDEVRTFLDQPDSNRVPGFFEAAQTVCGAAQTSLSRTRLLVVDPSLPVNFSSESLAAAAQTGRVTIHGIGSVADRQVSSLCAMTGGRYWMTDPAPGLLTLYQSTRHSYLVTCQTGAVVENVKVTVHTSEGWGAGAAIKIENA